MQRKYKKVSSIIGACLLGTGVVTTIPFVTTSCGKAKTIGSVDGKDWTGYVSGELIIQLNRAHFTAQIVDGSGYKANNLQMPSKVRDTDGVEYTITSIFSGNDNTPVFDNGIDEEKNLSGTLKLPSNLEYIGASAFAGCFAITGNIDIPASVVDIREDAFLNCRGIEKVNIENIHINIGYGAGRTSHGAFRGCTKLFSDTWGTSEKISLDPDTSSAQHPAPAGLYYLKNKKGDLFCLGTENIVKEDVKDAYLNTKIVIRSGTVGIAYEAFAQATNDTHSIVVDFSQANQLHTLPAQCFRWSDVTEVELNHIEAVSDSAFLGSRLKKIDLTNVTSIGPNAFYTNNNVPYLETVTFGKKITKIPWECFRGQALLQEIICSNVSEIDKSAFQDCKGLQTIECPNVSIIGEQAFLGCTGLTNADCSNVSSIGDSAFGGCVSLWNNTTSGLKLGKKLNDLNIYAFSGWTNLPSMNSYADSMKLGVPYIDNPNKIVYIRFAADDTDKDGNPVHHIYVVGRLSSINAASTDVPLWNNIWPQANYIANWAFEQKVTPAADSVTLGNNINFIGRSVFKNCANLKKVTLTGWTRQEFAKKKIGQSIFEGVAENGEIVSPGACILNTDLGLPTGWLPKES